MTLIVAGMHRSTTSALTGALVASGLSPGRDLAMLGAGPSQPRGHYEAIPFLRLNNRILAEVGASWMGHASDSHARIAHLASRPIADEARKLIESVIGSDGEDWVVKDPRFSLTLPFWWQVFEEFEIAPDLVVCVRNPYEVVESLRRRDGMPPTLGEALWRVYNLRAAWSVRSLGIRSLLIVADDVYAESQAVLERMCSFADAERRLGLDPALGAATIDSALSRSARDKYRFVLDSLTLSMWRDLGSQRNGPITAPSDSYLAFGDLELDVGNLAVAIGMRQQLAAVWCDSSGNDWPKLA